MPGSGGRRIKTSIGEIVSVGDGGAGGEGGSHRTDKAHERTGAGTEAVSNYEESTFEVFIDGCSKGNPGKSGAGYLIRIEDLVIEEGSRYLGITTNNQAEYRALLLALERCRALGIRSIKVKSDSQLMVNQVNGSYRVRNEGLMPLYNEALSRLAGFDHYRLDYIGRENNREADKLADLALKDRGKR
ncbi:ribonuclease HI family protein [candidate division KSB1 bacterium]